MKVDYVIYRCLQGSPEWKELRRKILTMSNAAAAIGMSPYDTPEELAEYITERKEKVFNERSLKLMKMGSERESEMRDWYCEKYPKYKVEEIGFCVPNWCKKLGCSPDGLVNDDGIIEIKHTLRIPNSVMEYFNDPDGKKLIDYIPKIHYVQIQGVMGIMRRDWCDYIVKEFDGCHVMIRIPFNKKFWREVQKPKMLEFVDKYL